MDVFLRLTTGECKEHVHMGRIALCGRQEMPYFKGDSERTVSDVRSGKYQFIETIGSSVSTSTHPTTPATSPGPTTTRSTRR